jgi:multicomponent K+:H+ antiporter subunit D
VLAAASWLYAVTGPDSRGPNYHALFQFQLMGICGAFLTGDAFNLFVFFEVLLIASYGLLLHGGGRDRIRAGLHYVVFNLVGSALFLIGVGTIYGVTGTLNMADIARKVPGVAPDEVAILASGALVLMVVFAIKAALLPLYFWLPSAYASATAPVAALFAIMTKVGVYAILRFYTLAFGADAGALANLAQPWILPLALLTLLLGAIGALAGRRLGGLVAYLVIASVGTMLTAIGLGTADSLAAAVYYMIHSTVVLAALFLLVDLINRQRGDAGSRLVRAAPVRQPALLGTLFVVLAVAASGLPPLSGFIGKVLILRGALEAPEAGWVFATVLAGGLLTLIAVSRAGSMVFWNVDHEQEAPEVSPARALRLAAVGVLLALVLGLSVFAGRALQFSSAIAQQLLEPSGYVEAVLDAAPLSRGHEPEAHAAGGGR